MFLLQKTVQSSGWKTHLRPSQYRRGLKSKCSTGVVAWRLAWCKCENFLNQELPQVSQMTEGYLAVEVEMLSVVISSFEGLADVFWWSNGGMVD